MSLGNRSLPSSRFQIDATTRGFSPKEETNRRRAFSFFLFDSRWRMVSSASRCTAAAVILMVVVVVVELICFEARYRTVLIDRSIVNFHATSVVKYGNIEWFGFWKS
jgi:hypothetical protein